MKTMLRLALGGSVLAASMAAHAGQLQLPNGPGTTPGNGNLLFFVSDVNTKQTYTLQLTGQSVQGGSILENGVAVNTGTGYFTSADALSSSTQNVVNPITGKPDFSYTLSGDTGLQGFISSHNTDILKWGIMGEGYASVNADAQGNSMVVTTGTDPSIVTVTDSTLSSAIVTKMKTDYNTLNTNYSTTKDTFALAPGTAKGVFGTTQSQGGTNLALYNTGVIQGQNISATAVTLYGLATNGTAAANAIAFALGTISFDGTTLAFTGNSPVPLPAAVWLFGSGLLGLLGIGRRRQSVAA